jgi:hypothetical protein
MLSNIYKPPYLLIINGRQGSGKSHFIRYLMYENYVSPEKFDYGVVFCNTSWEQSSFDYLPEKYVYENYNETVLLNLMKLQKDNLAKNIKTSAFVIFDDCLDDEDQWTSKSLKKLTTQCRHYNISVIVSTQYPNLVPPRMRSNSMYSIFFNIGSGVAELEAIYRAYGQKFKNYGDFKDYYYKNIQNHKFIQYDNDKEEYLVYRCPEKIPKFNFTFSKHK